VQYLFQLNPSSVAPAWALPPLRTLSDTAVDALRKHETGGVIPSTSLRCIRMARTETRARLRPMHLALLSRLLLHVNYSKISPMAMLTESLLHTQLDLFEHARIHCRRQSRSVFCGRCNQQLFPRRLRLCFYACRGSITGLARRWRAVHSLGWAARPL
jgi:hypothetical protein